jgi:hypothetical protein
MAPADSGTSSQAFDAVAAALQRAAAAVEAVAPRQSEAARLVRIGKMEAAFAEVAACISLWQDVRAAFAAAGAAIGQPVERLAALVLAPPGQDPGDPVGELSRALEQVKAAVHARDWVGLADAFEYDLGDLAQRWRSSLLQPDGEEMPASDAAPGVTRSAPAA